MYLTRRDGICYLRKRVPVDLVAVYGKREILRSLSVKDRGAAAVRLALRAVVALDDDFAQRRGLAPPSVERMQASKPAPSMLARPLSQPPTLDDLIPIWRRENNPTDKTAYAVARAVADVGNPVVATVARATVAGMRDLWLERGNSTATVSKKVGLARLLLTVARNRGLIEANPAEGMKLRADTRAPHAKRTARACRARAGRRPAGTTTRGSCAAAAYFRSLCSSESSAASAGWCFTGVKAITP